MKGTLGKKQNYGKKTRSRWKLWEKRRGKHEKKINEGSKKEKNRCKNRKKIWTRIKNRTSEKRNQKEKTKKRFNVKV
jgi:hypothetical protein